MYVERVGSGMVWQRLTGHINGSRVWLRSKSGDEYIGETDSDRLNSVIYQQLMNDVHGETDFWAWVEFEDGDPVVTDFRRGDRPEKPPWEHP